MAIRRFREHVARQDWFAVLIDVGIVVLGVFLGIQASNWNEGRKTRALGADYRQQILSDLDNNITDLASRRVYYSAVRDRSLATLAAIESSSGPRDDARLVLDAYQASEVFNRQTVRGAYDEMTASGLGPDVAQLPVRAKMNSYYAAVLAADRTFLATTDYRDRVRRLIPSAVQQYIRSNCGDRIRQHQNGLRTATLRRGCPMSLPPASVREAAARLRSDANLEGDLNRHIADLEQKILLFNGIGRLASDLRQSLAAA
ncbi:hypothetical protein G7076_11905 [Sphingomonas sp. HDW15A]|uniref:hypothetical protein n=1 Tax=Sphingomonas sp. HDW15A TaxID=2714942 RepID=UPI00140865DF|nr:hypothetical protein [Sphingomonas sp. HDW15A]QIK97031.1 hypothetical protein G7076_11905 [Sphingomonas sp. HDW15A]